MDIEKKWSDHFYEFALTHCMEDTLQGFYIAQMGRPTLEFFRKHKDELEIDELCGNSNSHITIQEVINNPELPWDYQSFLFSGKITWDDYNNIITGTHKHLPWGDVMPLFTGVTLDIVKNNPQINWDYNELSCSDIITEEFLEDNFEKEWDYNFLTVNPKISTMFMQKYSSKPWDARFIHKNDTISTYDFKTGTRVIDNERIFDALMKHNVQSYWFSECSNFDVDKFFDMKIDMVLNDAQLKEFYGGLSKNLNLNLEKHFLPRKTIPYWDFLNLSVNSNVNLEFMLTHSDLPWNYMAFSCNPNVNDIVVENNPSFKWYYPYLSSNNNITWDYVKRNLEKDWDFDKVINKDLLFSEILEYKEYFGEKIEDINEGAFKREKELFVNKIIKTA
jgi:hypothetical protein